MTRIKNFLSKRMNRWVEAQLGVTKSDAFTFKCPWPYLIYEPKKPKQNKG